MQARTLALQSIDTSAHADGTDLIRAICDLSRVAKECESNDHFQEPSHLTIIRRRELISARAAAESLAIFNRFDECSDHFSLFGAMLRLGIVAHVFAGLTDRV